MESKGFTIAVYNRTVQKVEDFLQGRARGKNRIGAYSLAEMVARLKKPRQVMLMVKAGLPVDSLLEQLISLLEPGDIIIDGGDFYFPDTIRRTKHVEEQGLLYVGMGVSGGVEGALLGPSLMPGGSGTAWPYLKPIFPQVGDNPCCERRGPDRAGHFVKTMHNGVEYGDM